MSDENKTCTDCKARQKGWQGDPDFFVELCAKHRAVDALANALINAKSQAHYFLCYRTNGYPTPMDRGDCRARHCVEARISLEGFKKYE